jgi:DNA-binding response OmpR family regulator
MTLRVRDLVLNASQKSVMRGSEKINLTVKEFALLEYLMRHPIMFSVVNKLFIMYGTRHSTLSAMLSMFM